MGLIWNVVIIVSTSVFFAGIAFVCICSKRKNVINNIKLHIPAPGFVISPLLQDFQPNQPKKGTIS